MLLLVIRSAKASRQISFFRHHMQGGSSNLHINSGIPIANAGQQSTKATINARNDKAQSHHPKEEGVHRHFK